MRASNRFAKGSGAYTLPEMLIANADDAGLCAWLRSAKVGDWYSAFVSCSRIA